MTKNRYLALTNSLTLHGLVISAGLVLASQSLAAKIYKWIDEDGKTHYSSTAPIHQESVSIGNTNKNDATKQLHQRPDDGSCDKATKAELLVGVWQLKKQPSLHFRFYDRWHKTGTNNESLQKYSFDITSGKLQTGRWSVKGDILRLKIETLNEKNNYFKTIRKARIHKINKFDLYLLINDTKAMKFERDSSSEFKPKCMEQNHQSEEPKQVTSDQKKKSIDQPIDKSRNIGH